MTSSTQPLVSLGLPTYNEARYLVETMDNLLKQTYPHIELIIADNGSTDETRKICREYAAKHSHIRFIEHPRNLGQHINFNYLPRCASGKYFCWVSGHDLLDPDFAEKSVTALETHPEAVLAYPRTMNMTKEGEWTREKARPFDIRTMSAGRRFREVMWRVDCNYVYGMFRLEPMLESKLFQAVPAADRVFLAEMAIKGIFVPVDTFKYYRMSREHVQTELEKRHRLMNYLHPGRTFTDKEVMSRDFYRPTVLGFYRVIQDAGFSLPKRLVLYWNTWLCGVMKFHLFPGADALSALAKKSLPTSVLNAVMRQMT